jgi:DNA repair exonuclease SbcCD nuclease subunit
VARKILIVNDIHARRQPPSRCTETYWPDLLDLLWQTVDVARDREADAVVWAGDVFDHKNPRLTDHGLMQDLIAVVCAYLCPVYGVPGNHDMQHDRPDSIDVTQPLGVLFRAGLQRLEGWAGDNLPLYGVPWQQEWSAEGIKAALAGWIEHLFTRSLVVTHAPIYPPGREPGYAGAEFTPAEWWSLPMTDGSFRHGLAYGHIHEPHGSWMLDGTVFCNYGALSRGSLDEYNLDREVGCALWHENTGSFEFVPLKARPAAEVFRLERRAAEVTARKSLDGFLAGVQSATLSVLSVEAVMRHLRESGTEPAVVDLAEELLAQQAAR